MPLSMLAKMIGQGLQWDIENEIKPIWYLRVIRDSLNKEPTTVTIKDMLKEAEVTKKMRTGEEITSEFMALIEREGKTHG